jgi:dihydrofolate reductase
VEAAAGKDVHVMGGADVIRQAPEADLIDKLTTIVAPVVLDGGKHLFEGFSSSLDLEHLGVRRRGVRLAGARLAREVEAP